MIGRIRERFANPESGAIVVMTAIVIVSLLSVASLSLDMGEVWSSRRHLSTGADAAALDAAMYWGTNGGQGDATCALVGGNSTSAAIERCDHTVKSALSGYATVITSREVDHLLAGLVGVDSSTIRASSTAFWGQPTAVSGLRPFGLCAQTAAFTQWVAAGTPSPSAEITIPYGKGAQTTACGTNAPGNWGELDFNGGSNSNSEFKSWVADGYPGQISAGQIVEGDTGAFSNSSGVDALIGTIFTLPVFDSVTGNGANATFHVTGFVQVQLTDVKTTGNQDGRYLRVKFLTGVTQGACCVPAGAQNTGLRVVGICNVDHAVSGRDVTCTK
jgi:hypothetical protein